MSLIGSAMFSFVKASETQQFQLGIVKNIKCSLLEATRSKHNKLLEVGQFDTASKKSFHIFGQGIIEFPEI